MTIKITPAGDIDRTNAHYVTVDGELFIIGTDRDGNGLWVDGKQVMGTAQFTLNGVKNVAAKLRRYAEKHL